MKILLLSRYARSGASSRMRLLQYLPRLSASGIEMTVAPLFSDDYVAALQQGRRALVESLRAYGGRLRNLLRRGSFDLLWIEKDCLPWLPAWIESTLLGGRRPYVLDYDDAVFHRYDSHRLAVVRRLLGAKHPALMRGAALVIAGNPYLADFARKSGAARVEIVPTAVDLERYAKAGAGLSASDTVPPCVGWIGQRSTAEFLRPLAPLFERIASEGKGRFAAIGIDTRELGLPMASVRWSEQTEVESIRAFDIGVMPVPDGPFERGKCGYKLIQYMACGLPVVASPVGVNSQIVEHGVNGFLADTPAEWAETLESLLADADLRQRMGRAGRRKVEREYCIQVTGPRVVDLLRGAAAGRAA